MRKFYILLFIMINISGCALTPVNDDLKSPCVANESSQSPAVPCVKRKVNDHWLI